LQRPVTAEDTSVSSGRPAGIGRATALAFTRATASTLSLAAQSDLDAVNAFNAEILSIAQTSVINNTVYLADFRPIGATELSLGNAW
jgi:NAD(P)-dependent dehydrogenase (short-subunit alcohol dehydrogenase family)